MPKWPACDQSMSAACSANVLMEVAVVAAQQCVLVANVCGGGGGGAIVAFRFVPIVRIRAETHTHLDGDPFSGCGKRYNATCFEMVAQCFTNIAQSCCTVVENATIAIGRESYISVVRRAGSARPACQPRYFFLTPNQHQPQPAEQS